MVSPSQQDWLTTTFEDLGLPAHRRLLMGVKATHKTQMDGTVNKYGPDWYPVGDQFADAVAADRPGWVFPVAQIYFDVDHVADPTYRARFLDRVLTRGNDWLAGVQFDLLPWHTDPAMVEFLTTLKTTTGLEVLVQAHGPAMNLLGPDGVARWVASTGGMVDHVLFDASHGTGTRLDAETLGRFVDATTAMVPTVGVAVAGGLSADAVAEDLPYLLEWFPHLSWDAEGSLHPATSTGARPLDVSVTDAYLAASAAVLTGR